MNTHILYRVSRNFENTGPIISFFIIELVIYDDRV